MVVSWGSSVMVDFSKAGPEASFRQQLSDSTGLPPEEEPTSSQISFDLLEDIVVQSSACAEMSDVSMRHFIVQFTIKTIDRPQAIHRPPWA